MKKITPPEVEFIRTDFEKALKEYDPSEYSLELLIEHLTDEINESGICLCAENNQKLFKSLVKIMDLAMLAKILMLRNYYKIDQSKT